MSVAKLIEGIAKTINTKSDERWLVVIHRTDSRVGDVEAEVRKLIRAPQNVSFITWGAHMATNDYVDVGNVILAGTLFFRPFHYEALKRLAAGRSSTQGVATKEEIDTTMLGEHSHLILQALCRGAVRRCDGDQCHPCDAYIIASVHSGIPAALTDVFPGCRIVHWKPVERTLKGHVKRAVEFINGWIADGARVGDVLPFSKLVKHLGVTSANLRRAVRTHPDFIEAVSELGVAEWGKGAYYTGFAVEA